MDYPVNFGSVLSGLRTTQEKPQSSSISSEPVILSQGFESDYFVAY
jgi:hypothetical protein